MTEMIQLTHKELGRAKMLALVAEGHTSVEAAAEAMNVSPRQVRRLLRRCRKEDLVRRDKSSHDEKSDVACRKLLLDDRLRYRARGGSRRSRS